MSDSEPYAVDPRALKILINTFWTGKGWREKRLFIKEDVRYAKQAGVMFEYIQLSHAESVRRAREAVRQIKRQAVADAFVVSLASRQLELRSALGSFAVHQHLPEHPFEIRTDYSHTRDCAVCGDLNFENDLDLNVLNFERFKWGGVRHDQPAYAGFDLQLFQRLPRVTPTSEDIALFKQLLAAMEAVPAKTNNVKLEKYLAKTIKSNKSERDTVVGILGYCGILATSEHPGFIHSFVPETERHLPQKHNVEMAYPACWWQISEGINKEAVHYWFGHLLN